MSEDSFSESEESELLEYTVETKKQFENGAVGGRWMEQPENETYITGSMNKDVFAKLSTTDKLVSMYSSKNTNSNILN